MRNYSKASVVTGRETAHTHNKSQHFSSSALNHTPGGQTTLSSLMPSHAQNGPSTSNGNQTSQSTSYDRLNITEPSSDTPPQHSAANDNSDINNSQAFSDWGDDIVANLSELESGFMFDSGNPETERNGDNVPDHRHLHTNVKEDSRWSVEATPSDTSSAQQKPYEITSPLRPRRNLFPRSDNDLDSVLEEICESEEYTHRQPTLSGFTRIKTKENSVNSIAKNRGESDFLRSPKRPHDTNVYPSHKSRRQNFDPVTNSDVSPLRRGLLDINMEEEESPV